MLSRASNIPVSIAVSSVICGSFSLNALLSLSTCCRALFSVAGVSVFICFCLITHTDLNNFFEPLQPLLASPSAWTILNHCIIITRVTPFTFHARFSVVPLLHDVLMLLSTYPLCLR